MNSHDLKPLTQGLTSTVEVQGLPLPASGAHAPSLQTNSGLAGGARHDQSGQDAPGGEAAPFLDIGCGNVPQHPPRKPWSRKQWLTRRAVLDRLNYWQANRYQCLWLTLTSSPDSPPDQLRRDFQTLRKRMARQLGYKSVAYVCVDTREGHGVLHMILAWKGEA